MKFLAYGLLLSILLAFGYLFSIHKGMSKAIAYVSSEECKDCHISHYNSWRTTLHPKVFLPVTSPDQILGDFESNDPAVTFKKEDIEYVVGSKWEQVYARKIDGEYYPFPAKWYISTQHWVPYKVKDWHEVNMSKKCNGCHTTGFDPNNFKFTEYGVGCEACHGPGSLHMQNQKKKSDSTCAFCHESKEEYEKDIISTVDSSVCGQCHNRGTSNPTGGAKKGKFNFPIKFSPGKNLDKFFVPMTPQEDKRSEFWWGNGVSKNRHQEFADWNNSKHSKAHRLLREKYTKNRGKLSDECLHCHSTEYRFAKQGEEPTLDSVAHGVTCVACHDPHGFDRRASFAKDGTTVCGGCHIDSISFKKAKDGKAHYPCPQSKVSCADCHMPYIVLTGGDFTIRSHAFKVINPADTKTYGMPNSCQNGGCHQNKTVDWAIDKFNNFYGTAKN